MSKVSDADCLRDISEHAMELVGAIERLYVAFPAYRNLLGIESIRKQSFSAARHFAALMSVAEAYPELGSAPWMESDGS